MISFLTPIVGFFIGYLISENEIKTKIQLGGDSFDFRNLHEELNAITETTIHNNFDFSDLLETLSPINNDLDRLLTKLSDENVSLKEYYNELVEEYNKKTKYIMQLILEKIFEKTYFGSYSYKVYNFLIQRGQQIIRQYIEKTPIIIEYFNELKERKDIEDELKWILYGEKIMEMLSNLNEKEYLKSMNLEEIKSELNEIAGRYIPRKVVNVGRRFNIRGRNNKRRRVEDEERAYRQWLSEEGLSDIPHIPSDEERLQRRLEKESQRETELDREYVF